LAEECKRGAKVTFLTAGGHIAHVHGSTAIMVESIAHVGLQAFPVAGEKKKLFIIVQN